MSEENKILHRLAIDLNRDIKDIKDNMSIQEFNSWVEYYRSETTLDTISLQLGKLSEMFFKANFEGDITYLDFMPNATKEEKEKLEVALKQAEIIKNIKSLGK